MNEWKKYDVIKELVDHNGNKNRTNKKLGISRQQIDHLIIKCKEKGKSGFIRENRGHVPPKTLNKSISEDIILLYKNKYYDFTFNHFKKFLKKNIFHQWTILRNWFLLKDSYKKHTQIMCMLNYAVFYTENTFD